jgi:hypothetical protein
MRDFDHIVYNGDTDHRLLVQHHRSTGGMSISERSSVSNSHTVLLNEAEMDAITAAWVTRRRTVTPVTPLIYSSGKHQSQNTQPWAALSAPDPRFGNRRSVTARYPWKAQAEADVASAIARRGKAEAELIEWDPNPIDAIPLNHVPNPIIADLRDRDATGVREAVTWWLGMLEDVWERDYWSAHQIHAHRVLSLYRTLFITDQA